MAGEFTMERIEGTVTTAISYAKTIDAKAREQIRRMCSYELTKGRAGCGSCRTSMLEKAVRLARR